MRRNEVSFKVVSRKYLYPSCLKKPCVNLLNILPFYFKENFTLLCPINVVNSHRFFIYLYQTYQNYWKFQAEYNYIIKNSSSTRIHSQTSNDKRGYFALMEKSIITLSVESRSLTVTIKFLTFSTCCKSCTETFKTVQQNHYFCLKLRQLFTSTLDRFISYTYLPSITSYSGPTKVLGYNHEVTKDAKDTSCFEQLYTSSKPSHSFIPFYSIIISIINYKSRQFNLNPYLSKAIIKHKESVILQTLLIHKKFALPETLLLTFIAIGRTRIFNVSYNDNDNKFTLFNLIDISITAKRSQATVKFHIVVSTYQFFHLNSNIESTANFVFSTFVFSTSAQGRNAMNSEKLSYSILANYQIVSLYTSTKIGHDKWLFLSINDNVLFCDTPSLNRGHKSNALFLIHYSFHIRLSPDHRQHGPDLDVVGPTSTVTIDDPDTVYDLETYDFTRLSLHSDIIANIGHGDLWSVSNSIDDISRLDSVRPDIDMVQSRNICGLHSLTSSRMVCDPVPDETETNLMMRDERNVGYDSNHEVDLEEKKTHERNRYGTKEDLKNYLFYAYIY